jgi:hypothetical protein
MTSHDFYSCYYYYHSHDYVLQLLDGDYDHNHDDYFNNPSSNSCR